MLDACDAATEFMTGREEEDLVNDKMLISAVISHFSATHYSGS
ncbi:hypothetical protein BH23PLA1_BH23PLA1_42420 [soil metagenome]